MWLLRLSLSLILLAAGFAAHAEDRIASFAADIRITRDGDVQVTETISVVVDGGRFRRGLTRDLALAPVLAVDGTSTFEIESVTRDGDSEPYRVDDRGGDKRIVIGKGDDSLASGTHTYEIVYRTDNRLVDAGDDDMFAWVASGPWDVVVDSASATLRLPNGVEILGMEFHAGTPDSPADNVRPTVNRGAITFTTVRGLQPGERLTIKIKIRRDAIKRPARN